MSLQSSTKAYYAYNNGAITTDLTGGGNTLTNVNTVANISTGIIGYGADFGSSNSTKYLTIASTLTLGNYQADSFSISSWVYVQTQPSNSDICIWGLCVQAKAQSNFTYNDSSGTKMIHFTIYNGSTASTYSWNTTLTTNTWMHVVFTKNGTTLTVYVNNSSLGTQTQSIADGSPGRADQFTIGRNAYDSANFWQGYEDETSIFPGLVLSTGDVSTLYNGGAGLQYPYVSPPTVAISAASPIYAISAQGNGNVTNGGSSTVTERGFCWSTSANPTTSNSKVIVSGTTGAYNGIMTPLVPNTLYHYRAYAINSDGTGYASDTTFTTLPVSTTYLVGRGRNRERLTGISLG